MTCGRKTDSFIYFLWFTLEVTYFSIVWNVHGAKKCWVEHTFCDTNFPLRREVLNRNCWHIFPQYASLCAGSTSWHEREINIQKHTQTCSPKHLWTHAHQREEDDFIRSREVSLFRAEKKNEVSSLARQTTSQIWCGKTDEERETSQRWNLKTTVAQTWKKFYHYRPLCGQYLTLTWHYRKYFRHSGKHRLSFWQNNSLEFYMGLCARLLLCQDQ